VGYSEEKRIVKRHPEKKGSRDHKRHADFTEKRGSCGKRTFGRKKRRRGGEGKGGCSAGGALQAFQGKSGFIEGVPGGGGEKVQGVTDNKTSRGTEYERKKIFPWVFWAESQRRKKKRPEGTP